MAPGPAPDPNALRRERDEGEWTRLPASGRDAPAPEWPLVDPVARELDRWLALWRMPQALMWERHGQQAEVALYVRRLGEAELSGSPVNLTTVVRQMGDSLGLTTPGLRSNRWSIDSTAETSAPRSTVKKSSRGRLTVVSADGA